MNNIEEIWEMGNEKISVDSSFDEEFIRNSISETSIGITSKLPQLIWFGVITSLVAVILFFYNLFFYLNNTPILTAIVVLLFISLSVLVFMLVQLRVINNMHTIDFDLHNLLKYKIRYFTTRLRLVRHLVALSIVFVTFGLNLTMEKNDGIFELNKILTLSIFYFFTYFIIMYLQKFTHDAYLKQLRNALCNLEENTLISLDKELIQHKRISKLIGIIITIIFLIGIIFLLLNTTR